MPAAKSLNDLLQIRNANSHKIDDLKSVHGTALGWKNSTNEPAILMFVDRKIDEKWVPKPELVDPFLYGPGNLKCSTDVVQTSDFDPPPIANPVGGPNLDLRGELRGISEKLRPGSQLAYWTKEGIGGFGTLACFVKEKSSGKLGILTNFHVGEYIGNVVKHPDTTSRAIGIVSDGVDSIDDEQRFPGIVDEAYARYVVDAAYIELLPNLDSTHDIDI